LITGDAVGIAGAVKALMVLQDGIGDRPGEVNGLQYVVADTGVHLDGHLLAVAELAGEPEDLRGDRDLADIMHLASEEDALYYFLTLVHFLGDGPGEKGYFSLVASGSGVMEVNHVIDDLHEAAEHAFLRTITYYHYCSSLMLYTTSTMLFFCNILFPGFGLILAPKGTKCNGLMDIIQGRLVKRLR
jgi:hypothetical protein